MCLDIVDSPAKMKKYLAKKPDVITAYKVVVSSGNNKLCPFVFYHKSFRRGSNISKTKDKGWYDYAPYFHSFVTKKNAQQYSYYTFNTHSRIIPVTIKKEDITATGFQCGRKRVIVSERIYIDPKVYDKAVWK